jgi:hypothetical protein
VDAIIEIGKEEGKPVIRVTGRTYLTT